MYRPQFKSLKLFTFLNRQFARFARPSRISCWEQPKGDYAGEALFFQWSTQGLNIDGHILDLIFRNMVGNGAHPRRPDISVHILAAPTLTEFLDLLSGVPIT